MKKSMALVCSLFLSLAAHAELTKVEQAVSLDVIYPCVNAKANLRTAPAMNVYTNNGGRRVGSFSTNQVFAEDGNLYIQASGGEKTLLGTFLQAPGCQFNYDNGTFDATWTNVKKSANVSIGVLTQGQPDTCKPYSVGVGGWTRTDHVILTVTDASIPYDYNMSWDEQVYFAQEDYCRNN